MEMQKQNIHDFFSFSGSLQEDVSSFGCSAVSAVSHQHEVETFERRRSKQQQKFPVNKKIFPWMKESRASGQRAGRRISGLYHVEKEQHVVSR